MFKVKLPFQRIWDVFPSCDCFEFGIYINGIGKRFVCVKSDVNKIVLLVNWATNVFFPFYIKHMYFIRVDIDITFEYI